MSIERQVKVLELFGLRVFRLHTYKWPAKYPPTTADSGLSFEQRVRKLLKETGTSTKTLLALARVIACPPPASDEADYRKVLEDGSAITTPQSSIFPREDEVKYLDPKEKLTGRLLIPSAVAGGSPRKIEAGDTVLYRPRHTRDLKSFKVEAVKTYTPVNPDLSLGESYVMLALNDGSEVSPGSVVVG